MRCPTARPLLFLSLALLVPAQGVSAQEVVALDSGKLSLTLPPAWSAKKVEKQEVGEDVAACVALQFLATGPRSEAQVTVEVFNGGAFELRPLILKHKVLYGSYPQIAEVVTEDKPVSHLVALPKNPDAGVMVAMYRRVPGRTLQLRLRCSAEKWKRSKDAVFTMWKSMKVDLSPWPAPPSGRAETRSGSVVYSVGNRVDRKQVKEVTRCFEDVAKGLAAVHGSLSRPKGEDLRIYINALSAEHKDIARSKAIADVIGEPAAHRLFTVPLQDRGAEQRYWFVAAATEAVLAEYYGEIEALWFTSGEVGVAGQRDATKKSLPYASRSILTNLLLSRKFAELAGFKRVPNRAFHDECFVYVAMFHDGPKEYKAAYRSFLAEIRKTGDASAAAAKHLTSMDQDQMLEDARAFLKKMRSVKVKR